MLNGAGPQMLKWFDRDCLDEREPLGAFVIRTLALALPVRDEVPILEGCGYRVHIRGERTGRFREASAMLSAYCARKPELTTWTVSVSNFFLLQTTGLRPDANSHPHELYKRNSPSWS
jgi:hypothetical protein